MARDLSRVLDHLSDDQISDLISRYYEGQPTTALIEMFGLEVSSSQLYCCFPPERLADPCTMCGGTMLRTRSSRNGKQQPAKCQACSHDKTALCRCQVCLEHREQTKRAEEDSKIRTLQAYYQERRAHPVSYFELSFSQRVYLGALLAGHGGQSKQIISPLRSFPAPFMARWDLVNNILTDLRASGALIIYPTEDLSPFVFPAGEKWKFYPDKVYHELNLLETEASTWLLHPFRDRTR
jgi:hypothetical protein